MAFVVVGWLPYIGFLFSILKMMALPNDSVCVSLQFTNDKTVIYNRFRTNALLSVHR